MSGSGSRSRSVASPMMTSSTGSVVLVLPTDPERPRPLVPENLFDAMFLFEYIRVFRV